MNNLLNIEEFMQDPDLGAVQEGIQGAEEKNANLIESLQREPAQQKGGGLGGLLNLGSGGTGEAPQTGSGGTDYVDLAKQGQSIYDKFQTGDGGGLSGYLAAATAFGKYMDWAFDKDATGGGIGRANVHILEDWGKSGKDAVREGTMWNKWGKPIKNSSAVKKVTHPISSAWDTVGGGIKNAGTSVAGFFSDLF